MQITRHVKTLHNTVTSDTYDSFREAFSERLGGAGTGTDSGFRAGIPETMGAAAVEDMGVAWPEGLDLVAQGVLDLAGEDDARLLPSWL